MPDTKILNLDKISRSDMGRTRAFKDRSVRSKIVVCVQRL